MTSILDRALRPAQPSSSAGSLHTSSNKSTSNSSDFIGASSDNSNKNSYLNSFSGTSIKTRNPLAGLAATAAGAAAGKRHETAVAALPARANSGASAPAAVQESDWHTYVAQLTATAYAIQAFPGRGGGLSCVAPKGDAAQANTEVGTAVEITKQKFDWHDLNKYLRWYAAGRYLTGGVANRSGPPWARQMPQISSTSVCSQRSSRGSRNEEGSGLLQESNAHPDRGQPLRLRAHACAGRVATLLWEHSDSLWRLLSRGDHFQGYSYSSLASIPLMIFSSFAFSHFLPCAYIIDIFLQYCLYGSTTTPLPTTPAPALLQF